MKSLFVYEANKGGAGGSGGGDGAGGAGEGGNGAGGSGLTWDSFLATLPKEAQDLYTAHTSGLKNALDAERNEKKTLGQQLRDLQAKAENGSDLQKQLSDLSGKLTAAEKKAGFAEQAVKPEIGCTNPKLAFMVATDGDLFKRDGSPDWDAIKSAAPELFAKAKTPDGNAGNGTGNNQKPSGNSMDDAIRSRVH